MIEVRLYGGLVARNPDLPSYKQTKFFMDLEGTASVEDIQRRLHLDPVGQLVTLVDGRPRAAAEMLPASCRVSIFPPMTNPDKSSLIT